MKQIWKFEIEVTGSQHITMPVGADVLCIQMQNGRPCIWVEVDPEADVKPRHLLVIGTGHTIPEAPSGRYFRYIGTVQSPPFFVWHLYEEAPRIGPF